LGAKKAILEVRQEDKAEDDYKSYTAKYTYTKYISNRDKIHHVASDNFFI
jgi:hypothetical protein